MNLIIVLVDTLRADHMSLYGYDRPTTPFIDRFASEAIVFDRTRAQASCNYPSVNSLFTSRYPFYFYIHAEGQMGIPVEYPTIAEMLQARGYHTIAVSASPIVRATPSKENPDGGFGAGFDVFDETCLWMQAECINERALQLVAEAREPFFLYLHYMDPHGHYAPPKGYVKRFAGQYDGHDFIAKGNYSPIGKMIYGGGPEVEITDRDMQHLVDLYDDEIRYVDSMFERLIDSLQGDGLLDRTALIFTSDHGEEFLEHGHVGHCRGVWDTLTRVPLLMKLPNHTSPAVGSALRCSLSTSFRLFSTSSGSTPPPSSSPRRWTRGLTDVGFSWSSSGLESQWRTRLSRASTAGYGTNV
jgi:arylsulfatase A-like enzyme